MMFYFGWQCLATWKHAALKNCDTIADKYIVWANISTQMPYLI